MFRYIIFFLALSCSQVADAHLVSTRFGEFYSGLLHPLTAFLHLVPWIALGLLAAQQPVSTTRLTLWIFPLAVIFGVVLGRYLPDNEWASYVNLVSFMIFGLFVVLSWQLPKSLFLTLILLFGCTHGLGNSTSGLSFSGNLLFVSGVALAAYCVVTLTSAHGKWLMEKINWGAIALRVVGSWVFAIGIVYGGFTLLHLNPV